MNLKTIIAAAGIGLLAAVGMLVMPVITRWSGCLELDCLGVMFLVLLGSALLSTVAFCVAAIRLLGRFSSRLMPAALSMLLLAVAGWQVFMTIGWRPTHIAMAVAAGAMVVSASAAWGLAATRRGGLLFAGFLLSGLTPVALYVGLYL